MTACSEVLEVEDVAKEDYSKNELEQEQILQDKDDLEELEQEEVEVFEPEEDVIINLKDLTSEEIIELKQRFLTVGTYLTFDEELDSETMLAISGIKSEEDEELDEYEIKSSIFEAFLAETDENFANLDDGYMMIVNKKLSLRYDYEPANLRVVNVFASRETFLEDETALATEAMFKKATEDGVELILASGYRDFYLQDDLFRRKVANVGFEDANLVVAIPGESGHQTGYVIDITSKSMNWSLLESFENTKEFAWLMENCADFGFIMRYPKDKVDVTEYSYEPWHYRYIADAEIANLIMSEGITLEEYYELYK